MAAKNEQQRQPQTGPVICTAPISPLVGRAFPEEAARKLRMVPHEIAEAACVALERMLWAVETGEAAQRVRERGEGGGRREGEGRERRMGGERRRTISATASESAATVSG